MGLNWAIKPRLWFQIRLGFFVRVPNKGWALNIVSNTCDVFKSALGF